MYTGSSVSNPTVIENILEPELFSRNFGPYITPDPISLDLWVYLTEQFAAEHCFQIQGKPFLSACQHVNAVC